MICNKLLTILKCPNTGQDILQIDDHTLCSSDKSYSYKIHNGIIYFTSNDNEDEKEINRTEKKSSNNFTIITGGSGMNRAHLMIRSCLQILKEQLGIVTYSKA